MVPDICHPNLPHVADEYFINFDPAALALLSEGLVLRSSLGVCASSADGVLWATVRAMERKEADVPSLHGLSPDFVESTYANLYRRIPIHETSLQHTEADHDCNLLVVLPPRCPPAEGPLDWRQHTTPAKLLASILKKFNFTHATNMPLLRRGLDVRQVYDSLLRPGGFSVGSELCERGTIAAENRALYDTACEKAAYVGSWLIRDVHIFAAASELGMKNEITYNVEEMLTTYDSLVEIVRSVVDLSGCIPYVSFPGPRPVTYTGYLALGVATPSRIVRS